MTKIQLKKCMKYFKITLRQNKGSTTLVYPPNYQTEIGNNAVDHLYYDENDSPMLLLAIKDKDAVNVARPDVVEITEVEAKTISENHETRTEKVTDEAKVRRIDLKIKRGLPLTPEEEKSLDPNDPTPGFGKSEILADRIDKIKVKG